LSILSTRSGDVERARQNAAVEARASWSARRERVSSAESPGIIATDPIG
jgi:hypothetical protein